MDITHEQSLAWAQFQALRSNPPSSWDEGTVSQFHEIISALESAFGASLSTFRIPDTEMKQIVIQARRASYSGRFPASSRLSDKRYCDSGFAQRQMAGIELYFQNFQSTPARPKIGF